MVGLSSRGPEVSLSWTGSPTVVDVSSFLEDEMLNLVCQRETSHHNNVYSSGAGLGGGVGGF